MTAPTLPDTLERLAELIPDRVRNVGYTTARVIAHDRLIYLDLEDPQQYGPWLETALREEIEARGWLWSQGTWATMGKPYVATATSDDHFEGEADTPAHALALALEQALGGEP